MCNLHNMVQRSLIYNLFEGKRTDKQQSIM
jgi:hypothetical protein